MPASTSTAAKTHDLITAPAPGTVIAPLFTYSEEQQEQISALREVRLSFCALCY